MRLRSVLDVAASMIVVAVGVVWLMSGNWSFVRAGTSSASPATSKNEGPIPETPVELPPTVAFNQNSARIVVVEFSDFECPFCGRFAREVGPDFIKSYVVPGKVQYRFANYPLGKHQFAIGTAMGALCAGEQGRFWDMHDSLFKDQTQLGPDAVVRRARELGLNLSSFSTCLDGPGVERLKSDAELARKLQISATPSFLIGTLETDGRLRVVKHLRGAPALPALSRALDSVLGGQK